MPEIINSSQRKIALEIFRNPGVSLRGIIEKTRLSPNYVSDYVNLLIRKEILKEERLEKKKVYLRRIYFNLKSRLARNFFVLVKEEEKELFYNKYKKLRPILEQISGLAGIEFVVVYGSYARLSAEKDSDLDLLIVGEIRKKDKIRETLVSLDIEASIKIETIETFRKKINDGLHQQIIKDNILVYDSGKFIEIVAKSLG